MSITRAWNFVCDGIHYCRNGSRRVGFGSVMIKGEVNTEPVKTPFSADVLSLFLEYV